MKKNTEFSSTDLSGSDSLTDPVNIPSAAQGGLINYFIFRAAKNNRTLAGTLLRSLNLYPGQELLMMRLWDEDRQTQSQLIDFLQLDASTVTKMVQRLEQQGFVNRERSEEDRRVAIVALTSEGLALKPQVEAIWSELEAQTTRCLTPDERRSLANILAKIVDDFESARD